MLLGAYVSMNIVLQKTEIKYWVVSPLPFKIVAVTLAFFIFKASAKSFLQNIC